MDLFCRHCQCLSTDLHIGLQVRLCHSSEPHPRVTGQDREAGLHSFTGLKLCPDIGHGHANSTHSFRVSSTPIIVMKVL